MEDSREIENPWDSIPDIDHVNVLGMHQQTDIQFFRYAHYSKRWSATDSQIVQAIIRAGSSLGWTMQKDAPGHIIGTLNIRTHIAIVDITYNSDSYSITYKDSTNLDYNGTTIHRSYNTWVNNLNNAIKVQMNNKVQLNNQ